MPLQVLHPWCFQFCYHKQHQQGDREEVSGENDTSTTICTLEDFQVKFEVLISRIFCEDILYIPKLLVTFRAKFLPPRRPTHFATELLLYFIPSMNNLSVRDRNSASFSA